MTRLDDLTIATRRWRPVPVDEEVARSYNHVVSAILAAGRRPRTRLADALIASTAHAHHLTLVTGDLDDSTGMEDLIDVVPLTTTSP